MIVTVYCASSFGNDPAYRTAAAELGRAIALGGHTMVYGGSSWGLMGVTAKAALEAGGRVIGISPKVFSGDEFRTEGLTEWQIVPTMAERRSRMLEMADMLIALPGGIGTLDEVTEAMVLNSINEMQKPLCFLNINGYYEPFIALIAHMEAQGMMQRPDPALCVFADNVSDRIAGNRKNRTGIVGPVFLKSFSDISGVRLL